MNTGAHILNGAENAPEPPPEPYSVDVGRIDGTPFVSLRAASPVASCSITLHVDNWGDVIVQLRQMIRQIHAETAPQSPRKGLHNGHHA